MVEVLNMVKRFKMCYPYLEGGGGGGGGLRGSDDQTHSCQSEISYL